MHSSHTLTPLPTRFLPRAPPQFLDGMVARDSAQKAAFLRDLPAMCAQFDTRVLRYKVGERGAVRA